MSDADQYAQGLIKRDGRLRDGSRRMTVTVDEFLRLIKGAWRDGSQSKAERADAAKQFADIGSANDPFSGLKDIFGI